MLLEAEHLSFAYGREPVVRGVRLSLAAGEMVTLVGPNASGKSTLIRLLAGLLQGDGQVRWEGNSRPTRRELSRLLAYLPQFPTLDEGQTVADVLRLGRIPFLGSFGLESRQDEEAVREVAQMLGLSGWLARPMAHLSGGQRQRVFLGRCLVQRPRVMLLDEPNSALDLRHQLEMFQILRSLARAQGVGILVASHELNLAGLFADRMLLLDQGSVAAEGPAAEVLREEILSRVYGIPMLRLEAEGRIVVIPAAP